eukprot:UN20928
MYIEQNTPNLFSMMRGYSKLLTGLSYYFSRRCFCLTHHLKFVL